ncbi:hypothetical protein RO3G_06328 [Rhizopus delemar RA 99-880]|uniref:Uncharacterized protein n=1 Tax=Rhizopus delemar (strain RA 99-880 / ATCC MYA-4621 / FGSC 9543 / NRRL 43880) TaxID=246409 RepID=I1BZJ3_RHIO9|nr:hypothetical protein RO3G_06328 [Rhizopus delemar RA 99-880]|eukprot:EIE81623.1 hypothetical protein RO3G_06328 [Rhizopus delemar RA 99-880]
MGEMTKGGFYPVITRTVNNKASEGPQGIAIAEDPLV